MMRPQFGSPPAQAHLVELEFATASAARRASFGRAGTDEFDLDEFRDAFAVLHDHAGESLA